MSSTTCIYCKNVYSATNNLNKHLRIKHADVYVKVVFVFFFNANLNIYTVHCFQIYVNRKIIRLPVTTVGKLLQRKPKLKNTFLRSIASGHILNVFMKIASYRSKR